DLFFCLDCGAPERLGAALAVHQRAPVTICVDHHDAALPFCQINAVDPDASSTSELVYLLIQPLAPLDKDVGTAIYAGIICDTGGFRHAASARTMRIASELLALGIPYTEIYNTLLKRHTLTEALVFRAALENLALASDGRIAHSRINAEALSGMNASGQDMDGVVEYLLNIQGTEAAALFYEKAPGEVKASLRSKELDIGAVARRFGGGGHKKAAGCTLTGEIKDISEKVLKALESALHAK
ncbi:MAG: DHH family phosphoesterase, partial [Clostridiales bacterium]|nr:DHH family phosphoesterase [Clostridiales bacterium]